MSLSQCQQFLNFIMQNTTDYDKLIVQEVNIIDEKKIIIQLNITQKIDNFIFLNNCLKKLKKFIQDKNEQKYKIDNLHIDYYFYFLANDINDHEYKFIFNLFTKKLNKYEDIFNIRKLEKYNGYNIYYNHIDKIYNISVNNDDFNILKNSKLYNELQIFFKNQCNLSIELKLADINNQNLINQEKEEELLFLKDLNYFPFEKKDVLSFQSRYGKKFWLKGYILFPETRICKNGSYQFSFFLSQSDNSVKVSSYILSFEKKEKLEKDLSKESEIEILFSIDDIIYNRDDNFWYLKFVCDQNIYNVLPTKPFYLCRKDDYPFQKRIEFHVHTKMSNLDAVTSAKDYLQKALEWGHEAIAFTDKNAVYAFPEIYHYAKDKQIKPIYGCELDFVEEKGLYITNQHEMNTSLNDFSLKDMLYVVFDIETTGFSFINDKIIEISAFKIQNNQVIDEFYSLVNPEVNLNTFINELTKITDNLLEKAEKIDQVLPRFLKFIEKTCLVAHNASFDVGFMQEKSKELGLNWPLLPVIDTLALAQYYFSDMTKYFSLKRLAAKFKVKINEHHRAQDDAKATYEIFLKMLGIIEKDYNVNTFYNLNQKLNVKYERTYDINIIAKNKVGYHNLFKILSDALTNNFFKTPRALKTVVEKYRQGILISNGSADNGNIFNIALNHNVQKLQKAISFYDYIEVQPPQVYKHLIFDLGSNGLEIIKNTIIKIIKEAKKQNKIVIASGNVHYLYPNEKIYREIYINSKLIGGGLHKLSKYKYEQLPDNHLLTTKDMLAAFDFLDDKLAQEIVIDNTHKINQQIEKIDILPNQLFSLKDDAFKDNLKIDSIKLEIKHLLKAKIKKLYGEQIHPLIQNRIDKEFQSIIGNEKDKKNLSFAPIYYLSHLLVKKSLEDGYLVGSRGSIGSSFIAKLLDITEVNPLKPHYVCYKCHYIVIKMNNDERNIYSVNPEDKEYQDEVQKVYSGYDLPVKYCPRCNHLLSKDGHDIPFETFLGFEGNKIPDIDLNFAGDYQLQAHNYIKELLGEEFVFRAGTIQTVAERNAYGYVKTFLKDKNKTLNESEISRRTKAIQGVKRSTGQHPGGIVIVPKDNSIYDVTPVQYPANDTTSQWRTTHFDYHSFENNLLKLDILGHDDPIMIKFLMDYVQQNQAEFTFNNAQDIPLDDPQVYQIFYQNDKKKGYSTLGIPEFGTVFVRQMLENIVKNNHNKKVLKFSDLVKISGLSHGTGVWSNNAEQLVIKNNNDNKRDFNDIIGCRDDIMIQLIDKNVKPLKAFEIMEFVRKGGPSKNIKLWNQYKQIMYEHGVSEWYIQSAEKIEYLFPKAHAVAYVIMAVRIAWFKKYKPLLFYSGYFSKRVDHFDYDVMVAGKEKIENKINYLKLRKKNTAKEETLISILKVALEFTEREEGFKFLPIDIRKSEIKDFVLIKNQGLLMPFISLDGLGPVVANRIIEERKIKPFTTKKDFLKRSKINKTITAKMESMNLLQSLADE